MNKPSTKQLATTRWISNRKTKPAIPGLYQVKLKDNPKRDKLSQHLRYWNGEKWFLIDSCTFKEYVPSYSLNENKPNCYWRGLTEEAYNIAIKLDTKK